MLRASEDMLLSQSMPRVPYVYLWMPSGCNWLFMPIIEYVHIHFGRAYFKAMGVKKDCVPYMIKIELSNVPVKSRIVFPDVDGFLYGPGYILVLPPQDVEVVQCRPVTKL